MLLLVIGAILLLAVVAGFGVYFDYFDELPSEWEWFFGILSVVGFVVGTVVFPQLVWGRPKLTWDFHTEQAEGERHLAVMFHNPPVQMKLLRRLGVHRQGIQSLVVQFQLKEAGSGTIVVPILQSLIYSDEDSTDKGQYRIALPPTYSVGASVLVASWDYKTSQAFLGGQTPVLLKPGQYHAEVIAMVDGEPVRQSRQFVVGGTPTDLKWVRLTADEQ